jgi:voltage-gated potassium channel
MGILALIFASIYVIEVLAQPSEPWAGYLAIANQGIWLIFLFDLLIRFIGASGITNFIRTNWLEILTVLLPFIRALRVFRILFALKALRDLTANRFRKAGTYILVLVPATWFFGAIAILDVESGNDDASIQTLRDALWWSLATITTVGYGDVYPKSLDGQIVAGLLMVSGIALFSAGAGIFASWILSGTGDKKLS